MSIKTATPYLFFQGDAAAAVALYEKALGAKVEHLSRFGEMPEDVPEEHKDRVMHASLRLGETSIMLSDLPPGQDASTGCRVEIALGFDDADEMVRCFRALGASGRIRMDVQDAFWGEKFGSLVDQFGIEWMFSAPLPK